MLIEVEFLIEASHAYQKTNYTAWIDAGAVRAVFPSTGDSGGSIIVVDLGRATDDDFSYRHVHALRVAGDVKDVAERINKALQGEKVRIC